MRVSDKIFVLAGSFDQFRLFRKQLTDVMIEYRPEHEKMLWGLGLAGNAFKKIYFDPGLDRQTAMYVSADDLVVPYGAANIETAERVTHVMRKTKNELERVS